MTSVNIYPCGIKVCTLIGKIEGMITCSSVRFKDVRYEITFNNDGKFESVWMNENEFETSSKKLKIGFK